MKKIIFPITALFLLAAILLMIWLNRTEIDVPSIVLTPEEAAVRHVREMETAYFTLASNSVEAVQTVALNDLVLVLVQYSGTRPGGGVDLCETVLETRKTQLNSWKAINGAGLCHEVSPGNSIPVTSGSSQGDATSQDPGYTTVYGQVRDPQITRVVVTWDDGHSQSVEVQESTYFAVREGRFSIKQIEADNDQLEIVYTTGRK